MSQPTKKIVLSQSLRIFAKSTEQIIAEFSGDVVVLGLVDDLVPMKWKHTEYDYSKMNFRIPDLQEFPLPGGVQQRQETYTPLNFRIDPPEQDDEQHKVYNCKYVMISYLRVWMDGTNTPAKHAEFCISLHNHNNYHEEGEGDSYSYWSGQLGGYKKSAEITRQSVTHLLMKAALIFRHKSDLCEECGDFHFFLPPTEALCEFCRHNL